jgi:hypothetical protein
MATEGNSRTPPARDAGRAPAVAILAGCLVLWGIPAPAVPIAADPRGYEGIPWGAAFQESADFTVVESSTRITGYALTHPPALGPIPVDSLRFLTIDKKFARVVAKYQGKDIHQQVLAYLEKTYGPLDRTPGQLSVGAIVVHNWRGPDTEINLTFDDKRARGTIFFESRALAPIFQDAVSDTTN